MVKPVDVNAAICTPSTAMLKFPDAGRYKPVDVSALKFNPGVPTVPSDTLKIDAPAIVVFALNSFT
jgi:hypothetical protein